MTSAEILSPTDDPTETPDQANEGVSSIASRPHLAFYLHHLDGGGVSRMRLVITGELARRGYKVDLLLCETGGPLAERLPEGVRVVPLEPSDWLRARMFAVASDLPGIRSVLPFALAPKSNSPTLPYLPALARYLKEEKPDVFYAATTFIAVETALALRHSGASTRFIISEHINLAPGHAVIRGWNRVYIRSLLHRTYSRADGVAAVSKGVADELSNRSGFPRDRITVVYNPTVTKALEQEAKEPLDHPWFAEDEPPVILGAGRLSRSKDFATLVRAFAHVRKERPLRLVILGNAKSEKKTEKRITALMDLAAELGVEQDVDLPGFVVNPYKYMSRASAFVLSSHFEGLPNALIEAMACGCPVISTDTPSGPAEILDNGRFGPIVPIGDDVAMAEAIRRTLDSPPDLTILQKRASEFSVERTVDRYEALGSPATSS